MNERLKRLLEERGRAYDQYKDFLAGVGEERNFTAEQRERAAKFDTDFGDLDQRIADVEAEIAQERSAQEARDRYEGLGRPSAEPPADERDARGRKKRSRPVDTPEYRDAFDAYMRGAELSPEQRTALRVGHNAEVRAQGIASGAVGGYLVPQGFYGQLTTAMKAYGSMIPDNVGTDHDGGATDGEESAGTALIETETGQDLPFPTLNDTANAGARLAENVAITGQDMAFGQVILKAWVYTSKLILVPWTLLQDDYFDTDTLVAETAGERLGRILNTELTTGTGTGASMPMGVVTAATLGVTLGSAGATPIYDDLITLQHAVDRAYRRNGKYMFNDATLAILRKLKDTQNRPLWEPAQTAAAPSLIAGKPYVVNNDMANVGVTTNKGMLFGDFSTYKVRIARDMSLVKLVERYADALQTGFFVWMRADGNLVDGGGASIKYLANP